MCIFQDAEQRLIVATGGRTVSAQPVNHELSGRVAFASEVVALFVARTPEVERPRGRLMTRQGSPGVDVKRTFQARVVRWEAPISVARLHPDMLTWQFHEEVVETGAQAGPPLEARVDTAVHVNEGGRGS